MTARLVLLSRAEERVAAVSAEAEADFARKRDENRELSAKAAIFFCCEILCRAMSRHLLKKNRFFFCGEKGGAVPRLMTVVVLDDCREVDSLVNDGANMSDLDMDLLVASRGGVFPCTYFWRTPSSFVLKGKNSRSQPLSSQAAELLCSRGHGGAPPRVESAGALPALPGGSRDALAALRRGGAYQFYQLGANWSHFRHNLVNI